MEMPQTEPTAIRRQVWNAGRTVGAKRALIRFPEVPPAHAPNILDN